MQDAQPMLDLTQKLTEGAVKERIRLLWDELDYNPYHRVGSVRKHLRSESMSDVRNVDALLWYERYLIAKRKEEKL